MSFFMLKKRNCRCGSCGSFETQKRGSQRGKKRYFCTKCKKSFSVDHTKKDKVFWIPHIDGIPFRKLADEYSMSHAQMYERVKQEMNNLPDNNWITLKYCNRFSGILVVDGKYVKVKGYTKKIQFIYGIDYLTHDMVVCLLAPSENEEAFLKMFRILKTFSYSLQVVVCDDRSSLYPALKYHYPKAKVQLCQNHYVENIRTLLHIRTDTTHQHFFNSLSKHIFENYSDEEHLKDALQYVFQKHAQQSIVRRNILEDIYKRRVQLFQYKTISHCPKDTNLIELFNSHINSRIKSTKGFQSFKSAYRWLNAYALRRRTLKFTDCEKPFKHLNGKISVQMTLKKQTDLSVILSNSALKTER